MEYSAIKTRDATQTNFTYNTPMSKAKTFANVNVSLIMEDSYSQMKTMPSTNKKKNMKQTNYIKIKTNCNEYYEGEVDKNFVRSGYGCYYYKNGDIYEGEFENGQRNGFGEYKYSDGCVYRGEWNNEKKEGKGVMLIGDTEYYGNWEHDRYVSGIKYQINEFRKEKYDEDADNTFKDMYDYPVLNQKSKNTYEKSESTNYISTEDKAYCNINRSKINLFDKEDETDPNIKNFVENWKIINFDDYMIDIEVNPSRKNDNKLKSKDSSDSTNTNLTELSGSILGKKYLENIMSLCYFDNFKKYFKQKTSLEYASKNNRKEYNKNSNNNSLNVSLSYKDDSYDDHIVCHCDKFLSEIL